MLRKSLTLQQVLQINSKLVLALQCQEFTKIQ